MRYRSVLMVVMALMVTGVSPVFADSLGQAQVFTVNTAYDALDASTVSSTLRAVGHNGYFYVDNRYWASLSADEKNQYTVQLDALSNEFDTNIYPRTTSFYGSENTPGIDADPHVVIMLEQLHPGNGGYFDSMHSYTKDRIATSNAREMVFVNVESTPSTAGKMFLAHEFQHLISFNQKELQKKVSDDIWLNEARSEYAITVSGYSEPYEGSALQRRTQQFLQKPSDSLVEWQNVPLDYGIASVFLHYLADRYGPDIIASTIHTSKAGVAALDEWLMQNEKTERFGDVFSDWMIASYLNDRTSDTRFGYVRDGLRNIHVIPVRGARLNDVSEHSDYTISLKEWQPFWLQSTLSVSNSIGSVLVHISGSPNVVWRGSVDGTYRDGTSHIVPFLSSSGVAEVALPQQINGANIVSATTMVTQGSNMQVGDRTIVAQPVTIALSLSDAEVPVYTPAPIPTSQQLVDGDLIRRVGQDEIYVVWGTYRRYLPQGVLTLYGFENRPVIPVSDDVFAHYQTSNYVREEGQKKVYALWPDGTKHWMNITPDQWDASARDWGAIFRVNSSEVNWYDTGSDITR